MKLKYDYDEQIIYVESEDGTREVIEDDFPSEPVISPDHSKAVYISPFEWECIGKLYLFDLIAAEKKVLIDPVDDTNVPKEVIWISDDKLAVIMGFGHGTVSIGGNVFVYDISTGDIEKLTDYDQKIQITGINLRDKKLQLEGIKYTDEHFLEFEKFTEERFFLAV